MQAPPEGIRVDRDLVYARAGERGLRLDLYLPAVGGAPLPLILLVHGGAWMGGSKAETPALPVASRGYAVASVEYRLSPEVVFPAQIQDCKAAVRWLRAHAARYGLDPDRFGAWGTSAGGHLVALLGTSGGVADLEGDGQHREHSSRVQAVCDWYGPTDFLRMLDAPRDIDTEAPDSPESRLIGGPVRENPEKAARANPITYVTRDAPPFLIMHGDEDRIVPLNQSELLYAALKKAGAEVTLQVVRGAGHSLPGPEPFEQAMAFFDRHLKAEGNR
jgi:acetyl esterase/lipase